MKDREMSKVGLLIAAVALVVPVVPMLMLLFGPLVGGLVLVIPLLMCLFDRPPQGDDEESGLVRVAVTRRDVGST